MKKEIKNSKSTVEDMLDTIRTIYEFTPEQWGVVCGLFRQQVEHMSQEEFVKFLRSDNIPGQMTILKDDEEYTNSLELTR